MVANRSVKQVLEGTSETEGRMKNLMSADMLQTMVTNQQYKFFLESGIVMFLIALLKV